MSRRPELLYSQDASSTIHVAKIRMMATGTTYLTRSRHRAFMNGCIRNSSSVCFLVRTNPAKMEMSNAPSGIMIRLVIVSAKSKNVPPKIFTSERIPNESALGIPTMKIKIPNILTAAFPTVAFFTDTSRHNYFKHRNR